MSCKLNGLQSLLKKDYMAYISACIVNVMFNNCNGEVCGLAFALFKLSLSYRFVSFLITIIVIYFFGEVREVYHVEIF